MVFIDDRKTIDRVQYLMRERERERKNTFLAFVFYIQNYLDQFCTVSTAIKDNRKQTFYSNTFKIEPPRDKINKMAVRPAKTQTSPG